MTSRSAIGLSDLERRLGHAFSDPALAEQALTHRSAGAPHNERLEFLGDAALGFLIAESLFQAAPNAREGSLTRARARLVRRETLAEIAREISLGEHLILGPGELKSGGRDRDSILADALEALLGAVLLDAGSTGLAPVVLRLFADRTTALVSEGVAKDPKTRLQEYLQGRGEGLPTYEVAQVEGEGHEQVFRIRCSVSDLELDGFGEGSSRRRAEQGAALAVLRLLNLE